MGLNTVSFAAGGDEAGANFKLKSPPNATGVKTNQNPPKTR